MLSCAGLAWFGCLLAACFFCGVDRYYNSWIECPDSNEVPFQLSSEDEGDEAESRSNVVQLSVSGESDGDGAYMMSSRSSSSDER